MEYLNGKLWKFSWTYDFTKTNEVLVIIIVVHTNMLDFRVKISLKCHDCDLWTKAIQIGLLKSTLPILSLILHWLRFHDHKCIKLLKNVTCHELSGAGKAAIWYTMWWGKGNTAYLDNDPMMTFYLLVFTKVQCAPHSTAKEMHNFQHLVNIRNQTNILLWIEWAHLTRPIG